MALSLFCLDLDFDLEDGSYLGTWLRTGRLLVSGGAIEDGMVGGMGTVNGLLFRCLSLSLSLTLGSKDKTGTSMASVSSMIWGLVFGRLFELWPRPLAMGGLGNFGGFGGSSTPVKRSFLPCFDLPFLTPFDLLFDLLEFVESLSSEVLLLPSLSSPTPIPECDFISTMSSP